MDSSIFTPQDAEAIFGLSERLTGNSVRGNLALANVARRLAATGHRNLFEYLRFVESDEAELQYLISVLVVHTTSWFREEPHYLKLIAHLEAHFTKYFAKPFRVLSAACSTGEEVYSFGLVLEAFRLAHPGFQYSIEGRDIDVLCIEKAARAVYPQPEIAKIPEIYHSLILEGSGKTEGLLTISRELRKRCHFGTWNLSKLGNEVLQQPRFDFVICRNVLIYFTPELVNRVIRRLISILHPGGALCLGHSESVDTQEYGLEAFGNSVYSVPAAGTRDTLKLANRRVLIVDDSPSVRRIMRKLVESNGMEAIEVESAAAASRYLEDHVVDLITLDLRMPGKDGQSWLNEQRKQGMRYPVVIISEDYPSEASTVFGALENGAQDYFHKGEILSGRDDLLGRFGSLMDGFSRDQSGSLPDSYVNTGRQKLRAPELILLGASIGGPEAFAKLLKGFRKDCPPIVLVQHLSVNFASAFAQHLAGISGLRIPAPRQGMKLERGCLYVAEGDYHLGVQGGSEAGYSLLLADSPPIKRHRPSVDFLFGSAAACGNAESVIAAILTGMGKDGAQGLCSLKDAGAMTLAQDLRSSVVFGMAKEAIRLGGVGFVGNLLEIRRQLEDAMAYGDVSSIAG